MSDYSQFPLSETSGNHNHSYGSCSLSRRSFLEGVSACMAALAAGRASLASFHVAPSSTRTTSF